jgi:alpha-N-arabinofuranosidase
MKSDVLPKILPRREFLRASATIGGFALCGQMVPFLHAQSKTPAAEPFKAGISVDAETVLHRIDPKIYGTFIEHLGRAVYGGIYEEGSPLSDEEGFRKDVLQAGKAWGIPVFRWPGGNFASGYHWMDGVGPKSSRPRRYNAAWYEEESNHFGTHECIAYCRKLGAEPYLCINMGTGTAEEASNWVEYCNGTGDTYFANLRRKNGQEQPFNVKYWGLGNEVYGEWQIGHKDAEDYAKLALETAKLMKWVDPEILLVACGSDRRATPADGADWNRVVIEKLVHIADYISVHQYEGSPDYYEMLGSIQRMEKHIRDTEAMIELTDPLRVAGDPILEWSLPKKKQRMQIAVDEWNVWYRKRDIWRRDVPNPVEEVYNLRDALWVASGLNLFQRLGKAVTMANLAQMVNVLAPMLTSKTGLVLQPTYFPMKLYSQECGANYLQAQVTSPTFSSKSFADVPYLDISVTADDGKKSFSLAVVNRHEAQVADTSVKIGGAKLSREVNVFEISGPPDTENTFADPHKIDIQQKRTTIAGENFNYQFPPHSVTLLKLTRA